MYELTFEDFEKAEDFRWYLKENTGIDLGKARETSGGEPPTAYYLNVARNYYHFA